MNGPTSMYKLRPAYKLDDDIELPKCMYRMKNIQAVVRNADLCHIGRNCVEKSNIVNRKQIQDSPDQNGMTPQIANLESRQAVILAQLAILKNQIADLRAELGAGPRASAVTASPRPCAVSAAAKSKKARICHDVVINANPKSPPYSLAALCYCWGKEQNIRASCHIHSSIQNVPAELKCFFVNDGREDRSVADINVTLAWKNVGDLEVLVSPVSQSNPILGEVNALRYLSRLFPAAPHNYEAADVVHATLVDSYLDLAHAGLIHGNNKERQAALRVVNGHLGRTEWFGGGTMPTIADMALWSALKQTGCDADSPSNVKRWLSKCNSSFVCGASGC